MFSYRHSFHAGNHADVLKHIVLIAIIRSLQQKEKGFLYIDTHAGVGHYQLSSYESNKTAEYLEGIARLWENTDLPPLIADYIDQIRAINRNGQLRYYAGSPLLAANLLRPQDNGLFTELHPSDFPLLRNNFKQYKQIRCQRDDGYQQLKAELPPATRRGLVLMDPPYELKEDYQRVVESLLEGYKRFATGTYAIWYPVVLRQHIKKMLKSIESSGIRKVLQIELAIRPDSDQRGMTASGMIVVNPPWTLEQEVRDVLPYLTEKLVPQGTGSWQVYWVVPE